VHVVGFVIRESSSDFIHLLSDRHQWRALQYKTINLQFGKRQLNFDYTKFNKPCKNDFLYEVLQSL
jgi:hypothetical protein